MSNLICEKCGATAEGKCPICRTIFPDDQHEAVLSHFLKFKVEDGHVKITFLHYLSREEVERSESENVEAALIHLLNNLKAMESGHSTSFKSYSCVHKWVFKPGCKSTIGCGHGE